MDTNPEEGQLLSPAFGLLLTKRFPVINPTKQRSAFGITAVSPNLGLQARLLTRAGGIPLLKTRI